MVRLTAALIVKNEERFLGGCLDSISGIVDEIVIVDTGSTDRTIEIAESYNVALLHRQWRDDFSWARNEALSAASGDWILYIDADERLTVPEGASLSDGLSDPDVIAAKVVFYPRLGVTPYREYRLFRNDPRIRFRGSMHETIVPDLQALQREGGVIVDSACEIQHLGYQGGQSHKHARDIPLLRTALERNPDRIYYWHHLSQTLDAAGDSDGALDVAAAGFARISEGRYEPAERGIASLLAHTYASILFARKQMDKGLQVIEAGLSIYPDQPQLNLLKARALLETGDVEQALSIASGLAAIDGKSYFDPALSHDRRIFDVFAHDIMGIALLRLGRREEAADAFERAARNAPDNLSYRAKAIAVRGSRR